MKKIINVKAVSSESYKVTTLYGESFELKNSWQPGQLYNGYNHHSIPGIVSRPLAKWLARQSWAMDGYLEVEGNQLIMVQPNHSFWYPQPDTKYAIAKIA